MLALLNEVWRHASFDSDFGRIPSDDPEVNGEMLQVLSRVYWMTGEDRYLDRAVRIGNQYMFGPWHPADHLRPWRSDLRFGAVRNGDRLWLSLSADEPWSGLVFFEQPRHREFMHLPVDWPRINQFQEWFTVNRGSTYRFGNRDDGSVQAILGHKMIEGVPVSLESGGTTRLKIRLLSL